jgi:hypothetical protein
MVAGGITLALVAAAIASIPVMPEATADIILPDAVKVKLAPATTTTVASDTSGSGAGISVSDPSKKPNPIFIADFKQCFF